MIQVAIGGTLVGDGQPCYVVAEIGINHNGDPALAQELIETAVAAGCNAAKFQKRTPELCVPVDQWAGIRQTPWGSMPYIQYKRRLELKEDAYRAIDGLCRQRNIAWFASCWDEEATDFIERYQPPCYKIASACLTDHGLLRHLRSLKRPLILSTGMSTVAQIDEAVEVLGTDDLILLHTSSAYPSSTDDLNLRMIPVLRERYSVPVGYSGHEAGLAPTLAAVALGACMVERHITLDRAMWGTDHAASVEPQGLVRLVRDVRTIERAMGDGVKKVTQSEQEVMRKLRRVA